MIALLQRVSEASVTVDDDCVAQVGMGLLVLLGVEAQDTKAQADKLCERLLVYRVFPDGRDRMNCSVRDAGGDVLVVPQFTLAADTRSGRRPSFSTAAPPAQAESLFDTLCDRLDASYRRVGRGVFGAHMQVALVNDGPVTFWLQV